MTSEPKSLFSTELLGALRGSDDRHAIAQLDVAIEKIAALAAGPNVGELVQARENIVRRMFDLARLLQENDDALALVEAVRRVV